MSRRNPASKRPRASGSSAVRPAAPASDVPATAHANDHAAPAADIVRAAHTIDEESAPTTPLDTAATGAAQAAEPEIEVVMGDGAAQVSPPKPRSKARATAKTPPKGKAKAKSKSAGKAETKARASASSKRTPSAPAATAASSAEAAAADDLWVHEPPPRASGPIGEAKPIRSAYFNRELSWLAFNRRVLELAQSDRIPLLERVKYLAIVSSNLDEFFEIRVAGLIQQVESGVTSGGMDGLGPREQLRRIHSVVGSLVEDQYRCWHDRLVGALDAQELHIKRAHDLNGAEVNWARTYFREQVLPVLTPLALDPAHPFPQLGNKTLNIVVSLDNPDSPEIERHVCILPIPRVLPRLVCLDPASSRGPQRFMFLGEIIRMCAGELFPGYTVRGAHVFRVTRNSDLYIDEEEAENLLKKIEDELRNLRRGAAVRLEIEEGVEDQIFETLCHHLELSHEYVFRLPGPINLVRLLALAELDRPELKFPTFTAVACSPLRDPLRLFDTLRERDVLLHHPYDSFQPVVDFVSQAAADPSVFAIKQTLYRTSGDSPVVRALIEASRQGKQVTALVELKARFDEANNIKWARELEEAGVHVVYGLLGHKIHCKCSLVVRRESAGMRRYVHLGTGNYNPRTARLYTDLSLFTCREEITADVAALFNSLTGFARSPEFSRLLVAPFNMHRRILELIERERDNAAAGRPARIIAKMNSLIDKAVIDRLYEAAQAGVEIDLVIRGICGLVPGLKGLSERIRVRSIVGRFLEHARVFYFHNDGGEPDIYAGSADWMSRNFFRRVEVLFPIEDPALRHWITGELLPMELQDNEFARVLTAAGGYLPVNRPEDTPSFSAQAYFVAAAVQRARLAE